MRTPFHTSRGAPPPDFAPRLVAALALLGGLAVPAVALPTYQYVVRSAGLVVESDAANLVFETAEGARLSTLAFAVTPASSQSTATFYVKNAGGRTATLSAATWSLEGPFSLQSNACATAQLARNERCAVTVRFSPLRGGDYSSPLYQAQAGSTAGTVLLPLSAQAPGAGAQFESNGTAVLSVAHSLRQGDAAHLPMSVYNNGSAPLVLTSMAVGGNVPFWHGTPYNNNCVGKTIAVGQRCTFTYSMAAYSSPSADPIVAAAYDVSVSISNSNLTTPLSLPMRLTVTPRASVTVSTDYFKLTSPARSGADICFVHRGATSGGVQADYFCSSGYGYTFAGSGETHCTVCGKYTE